jgi:glycosyltransferase involved in cell wall biosynthesis
MIAIFTAQIGNYHDARYRASLGLLRDLVVIAVTNEADFAEFLLTREAKYPVEQLFANAADYRAAITSGVVWAKTQEVLTRIDPTVVVVAGWATPESFSAIAWARAAGKRLVMLSDSQAEDAPRAFLRDAVKSRLVRSCDAALVAGRSHKNYIVSLGIPAARVFLGYDAVDNDHFERGAAAAHAQAGALRAQYELPPRYLLASARFIPKKNLPRLVQAYALAIEGQADAPDLVLLGDGPERAAIESAIALIPQPNKVHLPGFRSYDQLPTYYGLADGFVHVSTTEQWGLVINEAAAAGIPLVVSRSCGAALELVREGENGFLVDPYSVESVAGGLRRLMSLTPEARASMGKASQDIVVDWGPAHFADGLAAACEASLAQPPRRLAPWDGLLVKVLGRSLMTRVS